MRIFLVTAILILAGGLSAGAAPEPSPPPPPPAQSSLHQNPCAAAQNSADYVPGIDAYGRAVAPADLPGSSTDVQISTKVYAELRTRNPQLRGAGVMANLPGLANRPACPSQLSPAPPPERR